MIWWLSFARPSGFLGVAIVEAGPSMVSAVEESIRRGANPGPDCEVVGRSLPTEIPPEWMNRLLPEAEAQQIAAEINRRAIN